MIALRPLGTARRARIFLVFDTLVTRSYAGGIATTPAGGDMGRALSLLVHAAGTAAVTALTACGTLPPTASPPAEPSTTSKPLGVVAFSDGASITLYTGIGPCANGARFAEHMTAKGNKIPGCWLFHSGYVLVGSLPSGEWISIPHTRFKLVSEL